MLSSGGTAEGLIKAVEAGGGVVVEALFASEKVNTGGRKRLGKNWPRLPSYSLCYFVASGQETVAHTPGPLANSTPIQSHEDAGSTTEDSMQRQASDSRNNLSASGAAPVGNIVQKTVDREVAPGSSAITRAQVGLIVFSGLYTMLFSGAIFGWGPMQLM